MTPDTHFICLTIVLFPDSPAPKMIKLIWVNNKKLGPTQKKISNDILWTFKVLFQLFSWSILLHSDGEEYIQWQ